MNKAEAIKEVVEATSGLSTGAWVGIIVVGLIILTVVIVLNLDKINKLLFGDKKGGLLNKPTKDSENPIIQYVAGWHETLKLSDTLKLSNLENLLDFLKAVLVSIDSKKVASKKLTIDLSETDKINSTAIKDITSFIELCISEYPQVEIEIFIAQEPSEQLRLSKDIWVALINSFKTGGRNDINVNVVHI